MEITMSNVAHLLFIYFNLFPYIPFRHIPWKWKKSRTICIFRQLTNWY